MVGKQHLGVAQTLHVGLHSAVDRGVELAQQRYELQPDAVAAGLELGIGHIVDKGDAVGLDVGIDFGPREGQQRMNHAEVGVVGDGPDAVEAGEAGATEEVEEEGLDRVVGMVCGGHAAVAVAAAEVGKEGVAQLAGGFLDALAVGGGIVAGVEVGRVERHAQLLGKIGHEALVAVAVAGAQMEVAMGYGEAEAGEVGQTDHAHRIAAATNGQQHLATLGEEVLLSDVVFEAGQHQRMIILRIWRPWLVSMP